MNHTINYIPEIQITMSPVEAYSFWNALRIVQRKSNTVEHISSTLKELETGLADAVDNAKVFDPLPR